MRVATRRLLIAGTVATAIGAATALPSLADHTVEVKVAAATGTPVPGRYIVTLKDGASTATEAGEVKATGVQRFDGVLNGFSAKLSSTQLDRLKRSRQVASIEPDQVVRITDTTQKGPRWGLDRIDQRKLPLSKSYTYRTKGTGVHAYVIDTGIYTKNTAFGGRANSVWTAERFNGDGNDCNGHGTHVAGIIGSKNVGVAKNVRLHSLRVLDCDGNGTVSDMIKAAQWLRSNAVKPAVANISVGGPKSAPLNTAVANLAKSGVFVAVAAGNDGENACDFSPAGAGPVVTVGATNINDRRPSWSNYGKCVDISAPGDNIWSTWNTGPNSIELLSGTSMATPFVTGTAALYKTAWGDAPSATIEKWLVTYSTKGVLKGLKGATPNRLLFKRGL